MKTDKNTVIGFVLLGILFIAYFTYTSRQQQALLTERKHTEDSITRVNAAKAPVTDQVAIRTDSLKRDSIGKLTAAGTFQTAANGSEQLTVVENPLVKITFTNKGGQPKRVELKKYKSGNSNVIMAGSRLDNLSYPINTSQNQSTPTSSLYFAPANVTKAANGSQVVTYNLSSADGQNISHQFILKPNDYIIDWNVILNGADRLLTGNTLNLNWQVLSVQQQPDVKYERTQSRLCYLEDGDYDFTNTTAETTVETFEKPVKWFSVKQQFFNHTLIAKNNFASGEVTINVPDDASNVVEKAVANMQVKLPAASS
ncbi:MAG: membrane protein insertase YidC, partial [Segetibacter sp.]|nr:membrane protein insertase YidC [Segetibacter sp.]